MIIPLHHTYIHPSAPERVNEVLRTTFLSEGKTVVQFEEELENYLGVRNCVAVNSGTSALHLALVLAGVGDGDEVILPAQTFIATGLVILQQKAIPVFADIEYQTGNISVASVRACLTPRTKAILVVHWGGYPCDLDEINTLARERSIQVIEDGAHALGATYHDRPVGSISPFTCFSFQAIKHVTTGDGGALCALDQAHYRKAMAKRWFGIDRHQAPAGELGERQYDLKEIGYKYHLNNFGAALGLANLIGFKERLNNRRAIAEFYREKLAKIAGVELWQSKPDRSSAWWLFGFHVHDRIRFIRALKNAGITTSVVHQRIDRNSVFGRKVHLPEQEKFDETQIHIPIHDDINMEKANFIVETIGKGW